jgi:hypothetical protein
MKASSRSSSAIGRPSRFFQAPQSFQPLLVHGRGFAHNQLIQKLFLGAKVVMDGRQIDPGSGCNVAQRNGLVALFAKQPFGRIQRF